MIPKAAVDKIPILSMAYGLSASADGNNFPWVFNPPATYWDGASAFVRHAAEVEGGFDKLKGKTIGLVHLDAPYGKEPIPLFEALAKDYGFTLKLYPVPGAQMQNQTSLWLDVRRDRPDWIYLQGWGAMNPTALKEASKIDFPMNRLVGVWWAGGEDDVRPAGELAKGYSSLNFSGVGQNFPAIQDILKYVVDKGKSQVASRDKVGENLYNRGVMNAVLITEAIRAAQRLTDKLTRRARRGLRPQHHRCALERAGPPRLRRTYPLVAPTTRSPRHLSRRWDGPSGPASWIDRSRIRSCHYRQRAALLTCRLAGSRTELATSRRDTSPTFRPRLPPSPLPPPPPRHSNCFAFNERASQKPS